MTLAAALFDSYRTPATFARHIDGTIDEAQQVTPGMWARFAGVDYGYRRMRS